MNLISFRYSEKHNISVYAIWASNLMKIKILIQFFFPKIIGINSKIVTGTFNLVVVT